MPSLWDPLTHENLMAGTVSHFEKQEPRPLGDISGVEGPGIYALYYKGAVAEYQPIADGKRPIYAVPHAEHKRLLDFHSPGCEFLSSFPTPEPDRQPDPGGAS